MSFFDAETAGCLKNMTNKYFLMQYMTSFQMFTFTSVIYKDLMITFSKIDQTHQNSFQQEGLISARAALRIYYLSEIAFILNS